MTALWWTLTILLMLIGLAGTVVPLLPGTTIILAAAVAHHLLLPGRSVGWWTIAGLAALTVLSFVVDFVSGAVGAKYFGATRWGAIGGIVGAIAGLFFGFVGVVVGPLAGVLVGELLGGKGVLPAGKSTWGTLLGTTAGMLVKVGIGVAMIGWFLLAALG